VRVTPDALLEALATAYAAREPALHPRLRPDPGGLAGARAARLGVRSPRARARETLHGVFETVDAIGQLVLDTPHGRVEIAAADIFF
jgi:BirA family biotin operon repressor/biotin-[acetyl-CoA-carboxylase] ligase